MTKQKTQAEQIRALCKAFANMKISDKRKKERMIDMWNNYTEMGRVWAEDRGAHMEAATWRGFYGAVTISILNQLTINDCLTYINEWADKLELFERGEWDARDIL